MLFKLDSRTRNRLGTLLTLGCLAVVLLPTTLTAAAEDSSYSQKLHAERPIAAQNSLWIEELTWMEVRDQIASGYKTIIIPTGGIEENGPFLATGKHNVILQASCPAIAAELGDALCAPIVKFVPEGSIDPPSRAMRFPGTISLQEDTFVALLEDIGSSLKQHGFDHVVFIGDSGGNQTGMRRAADALNARWSQDAARAFYVEEFYEPGWTATEAFTERELSIRQTRDDGHHDDIWVTAMMMVTDPQSVRYAQRRERGLDSINGVSISPVEKLQRIGKDMIAFRSKLTAEAIRRAFTAPKAAPDGDPSRGTSP